MCGLNSPEEIFKIVARQRGLNNVPGDEWIYSNTNYFLLGMVDKTGDEEVARRVRCREHVSASRHVSHAFL